MQCARTTAQQGEWVWRVRRGVVVCGRAGKQQAGVAWLLCLSPILLRISLFSRCALCHGDDMYVSKFEHLCLARAGCRCHEASAELVGQTASRGRDLPQCLAAGPATLKLALLQDPVLAPEECLSFQLLLLDPCSTLLRLPVLLTSG